MATPKLAQLLPEFHFERFGALGPRRLWVSGPKSKKLRVLRLWSLRIWVEERWPPIRRMQVSWLRAQPPDSFVTVQALAGSRQCSLLRES